MQNEAAVQDLLELAFAEQPSRAAKPLQDPRLLTILRVGKLTTDRFEELCLVRNVGVNGLLAHVHSPLVARQRVRIELRSDRKLWGSVMWLKDGVAGIGFDGQIGIEEVLARADAITGRRSSGPRLNIDCRATLRIGAKYCGVRVHDLGQMGVGISTTQGLEDGQEVVVTLEGFRPIKGSALWCRNGRAGIVFNLPIAFEELTRWLQDMFGSASVKIRGSQ